MTTVANSGEYTSQMTSGHSYNTHQLGINASKSNSIYGNSTTVTPKSQKTNFFIKY